MLGAPLMTDLPRAPWEIKRRGMQLKHRPEGYPSLTPQHVNTFRPRGYPGGILTQPEGTVNISNKLHGEY